MSATITDNWFARMRRGEVPRAAVAELLGETITQVDLEQGLLEARYIAAPSFLNPAGGVQGGMLGAMLDALTAGLVDATVAEGEAVATLSLNLAFLRPAAAGAIDGRAQLVRRGREVCHVSAELLQAGRPVASATAVCKIVSA
ncbi:PaaI family thioesterase [Caldimonas sp. KR1-144]|uniref:PaaI family thioesterase n=1 Tax=Caldimonas sp. KR1-144 TaxID=3400911 RepID=UPI003C010D76